MSDKQPIPWCACGAPLICTFAFAKHEFLCLDCGRQYDWFGPEKKEPTKKNLKLRDEYAAEWEPIGRVLIERGTLRRDCAWCNVNEDHLSHATTEERAAHEAALEWIKKRIRK